MESAVAVDDTISNILDDSLATTNILTSGTDVIDYDTIILEEVIEAIHLSSLDSEEYKTAIETAKARFKETFENLVYCAEGEIFDYEFFLKWKDDFRRMLEDTFELVANLQRPPDLESQIHFAFKLHNLLSIASEEMSLLNSYFALGTVEINKAYNLQVHGLTLYNLFGQPNIDLKGFSESVTRLHEKCYHVMSNFPNNAVLRETDKFKDIIAKAFDVITPLTQSLGEFV